MAPPRPNPRDPFDNLQEDQPAGISPIANLSTSWPMGDGSARAEATTNVDNRQRHFAQPAANSFNQSESTIGNAQPYPSGLPPLHAHSQGVYQVPSIGAQQFSVSHPCPPSQFEHYEPEQRFPAAATHDHHDRAFLPPTITISYGAPSETHRDSLQSEPSSFSSRRYDPSHPEGAQSSIGDKTQNEQPSSHVNITKLVQATRIPHGAPVHIPSTVLPQGSSSQTGTLTGSEATDNKAIYDMIMSLIEPQIVSRIEGTVTEVNKEVSDHFECVVSGQTRQSLDVHIQAIARQTTPLVERIKDEMKPWITTVIQSESQKAEKDINETINRTTQRSIAEKIKQGINERFMQNTSEIQRNVAEKFKRDAGEQLKRAIVEITEGVNRDMEPMIERSLAQFLKQDIEGMIERSVSEWIKRDIEGIVERSMAARTEMIYRDIEGIIERSMAARIKREVDEGIKRAITGKVEQYTAMAINMAKLKLIESNKTDLTTRFNSFKGALSPWITQQIHNVISRQSEQAKEAKKAELERELEAFEQAQQDD